MTAISMSDDPDSRKSFGPFMQGIELVPFNNFDALFSKFFCILVILDFRFEFLIE